MKQLLKKETQFIFVILNAGLAGGLIGVGLQNFVAAPVPVMSKIGGFLAYFAVIALILGISTRYYTKLK